MPAGVDDIELLEQRIEEFIRSRLSEGIEQTVASELQRQTAELRERWNETARRQDELSATLARFRAEVDDRLWRIDGLRREVERLHASFEQMARRADGLAKAERSAIARQAQVESRPSFSSLPSRTTAPADHSDETPESLKLWLESHQRVVVVLAGLVIVAALLLGAVLYLRHAQPADGFGPVASEATYDSEDLPERPSKALDAAPLHRSPIP